MFVIRFAARHRCDKILSQSFLLSRRGAHVESVKVFDHDKVRSRVDYFGGVFLDTTDLVSECSDRQFGEKLAKFEQQCVTEKRPAIWVKIVLERSSLIGTMASLGYTFHHAKGSHCVMTKWLDQTCASKLPLYCTHRVASGGIVIQPDRNGRISAESKFLFIRERHSPYRGWKFPGGMLELNEHLPEAAQREVFEETSVQSKFESVLAFRQAASMPPFGISDLYVLCRLTALTTEIKPCAREVEECRWFRLDEFKAQMEKMLATSLDSKKSTATLSETKKSEEKSAAKAGTNFLAPMVIRILRVLEHGVKHGFETIEFRPHEIPSPPSSKVARPAIFFHHPSIGTQEG